MKKSLFVLVFVVGLTSPAVAQECYDPSSKTAVDIVGYLVDSYTDSNDDSARRCLRLVLERPLCIQGTSTPYYRDVTSLYVAGMPKGTEITAGSVKGKCVIKKLVPGRFCEDFGVEFTSVEIDVSRKEFDWKNRYPEVRPGVGRLGYGQADRVIWDIAGWNHPVKDALTSYQFSLTRVETYASGTFAVFYVVGPWTIDYLRKQYNGYSVRIAADLLKANYFWAYELVDADGKRYIFNSVENRMGWGFVENSP